MYYLNKNIPVKEKLEETDYPIKTSEIHVRDPFIVNYGDTYLLYRSDYENNVLVYKSLDLENWSNPTAIFSVPDGKSWGHLFWAPEVHYYKGNYYLITSYADETAESKNDVIFIAKCSSPVGKFEKIAEFPIKGQDVIDGTLWIEDGTPYLVYSHCFTTCVDKMGTVNAVKLSEDLTEKVGEDFILFKANDPCWTDDRVAEAPFLFTEGKDLYMVWSNYADHYYLVGVAKSSNGKLDGKWEHFDTPLYAKNLNGEKHDGGHAMVFNYKDGDKLCLHSPNGIFLPKGDVDKDIPEGLLTRDIYVSDGKAYLK